MTSNTNINMMMISSERRRNETDEEDDDESSSSSLSFQNLLRELEHTRRAHEQDLNFIRNLLYTLSQRGYQSVSSSDGEVSLDLSGCKGDCILDLRPVNATPTNAPNTARPQSPNTRARAGTGRPPWTNDMYYKAIIGNQEKAIQCLSARIEALEQEENNGNTDKPKSDNQLYHRITTLEREILYLTETLEQTFLTSPEFFNVLRDLHQTRRKQSKNNSRGVGVGPVGPGSLTEQILERCQPKIKMPLLQMNKMLVLPNPTKETQTQVLQDTFPSSSSTINPQGPQGSQNSKTRIELGDFEKFVGVKVVEMRNQRPEESEKEEPVVKCKSSSIRSSGNNTRKVSLNLNTNLPVITTEKERGGKGPEESKRGTGTKGPPMAAVKAGKPNTKSKNANTATKTKGNKKEELTLPLPLTSSFKQERPRPGSSLAEYFTPLTNLAKKTTGVNNKVKNNGNGMKCPYCSKQMDKNAGLDQFMKHLESHLVVGKMK